MNTPEFLLTKLIEECSEVIKACSKALVFGLDDTWDPNSDLPKWDLTPRQEIRHELNDVAGVAQLLRAHGILPPGDETDLEEAHQRVLKIEHMNIPYAKKAGTLQ